MVDPTHRSGVRFVACKYWGRTSGPEGSIDRRCVVIEPFREIRQDGSSCVRQEVLHIGAPPFVQQLGR